MVCCVLSSGYEEAKSRLGSCVGESVNSQLTFSCPDGSATSIYYAQVLNICSYTYGRHSASCDLVVMHLRLGYGYSGKSVGLPLCLVLCVQG